VADEIEDFFERGVTDGLPVVPPTRARVDAMLAATTRDRHDIVAQVPPNMGRATVEKIAVNAVMAGCRPDYFPVVLAVVEAACDPVFNLHGQSGTTNAASPLIILNGPVRQNLGVNCAAGVFGPGYRANATIGRALRLIMINLGALARARSRCRRWAIPAATRTASASTRRRRRGSRSTSNADSHRPTAR